MGGNGGAMRQAKVLVADDNEDFRTLLGRFVAAHEDLLVVGRAADGVEAVAMTETLLPDVVLMDLFMPRMSGFEATQIIAAAHPNVSVIALTAHHSEDNERSSRDAGARAFVSKANADMRLIELIRCLASGTTHEGGGAAK